MVKREPAKPRAFQPTTRRRNVERTKRGATTACQFEDSPLSCDSLGTPRFREVRSGCLGTYLLVSGHGSGHGSGHLLRYSSGAPQPLCLASFAQQLDDAASGKRDAAVAHLLRDDLEFS